MPLLSLERRSGDIDERPESSTAALVGVSQRRTGQRATHPDDHLAALGLRSVADLLAPSSLVIADNHVLLDGQYTRVLANELFSLYASSTTGVVMRFQLTPLVIGIETAIPCSLIVNEPLSNLFKY